MLQTVTPLHRIVILLRQSILISLLADKEIFKEGRGCGYCNGVAKGGSLKTPKEGVLRSGSKIRLRFIAVRLDTDLNEINATEELVAVSEI
ncbi:hypothetical protein L6452_05055 [Arctium lappa]|uniref:Uncharacterized protein n=1 Tax=Arctium lappa TaxID=4217 RepID=A0ACB9EFA9_ARCLA|nr:hypothetical protein L6452_05055 [Arctium lappa]